MGTYYVARSCEREKVCTDLGVPSQVVLSDFREAQDIMTRRTREFDRSDFFGDL